MNKRRARRKINVSLLLIALCVTAYLMLRKPLDSPLELTRESVPDRPRVESTEVSRPPADLRSDRSARSSGEQDFDDAKRSLRKLFGRGRDFYCSCNYDLDRRPQIDPGSCGLRSKAERARRLEWEHVVPASAFGRQFAAWKQGDDACGKGRKSRGRDCARKMSASFRNMEGDMYNLVPAVGELNRVRADLSYGLISGEPREFGACDFEQLGETVEPRDAVRGDIARIYFYMDARYPEFKLVNESNRTLFERWDAEDPLDAEEALRLRKIEAVQGNSFFIGRLSSLRQAATRL